MTKELSEINIFLPIIFFCLNLTPHNVTGINEEAQYLINIDKYFIEMYHFILKYASSCFSKLIVYNQSDYSNFSRFMLYSGMIT